MDFPQLLNVSLWALLLVGFALSFPKHRAYWLFGILIVLKGVNDGLYSEDAMHFRSIIPVIFTATTLAALILSFKSPNYRWLFTGALIVKIPFLIWHDAMLKTGVYYYALISIHDLLIITLISKRASLSYLLSKQNIPLLSSFSKSCIDSFGFSIQERMIVFLFRVSIFINVAGLIEKLIRANTDYSPLYVYKAFPPLKLLLALMMFLIVFSIATNRAKGIATGRPIA